MHDELFDHLVYTFRRLGVTQISLEELAEKGDVHIATIDKEAMRNALLYRGYEIKDGLVRAYEGHGYKTTVSMAFRKFSERAAEIIDTAGAPIMPADLVRMVGLVEARVPLSAMTYHLKKVGVWFIPGIGYWHKRHFVDERGVLYGHSVNDKQSMALYDAFKEYGWPMTAIDLDAATNGVVTSQYLKSATARSWPDIISVGYGLYVPAGAARRVGFPMSKNLAEAFIDLKYTEVIDSLDNRRMYRMCDLLQKMGYGVTRRSNTVRDGKQRRTAFFKLNETGRKALSGLLVNRKPQDEF